VEGDVNAANAKVPTVDEEPSIPSPTPPTSPSQPSQDIPSTSQAQPTPPQSPQVQPQSPQHQPQQDVKIPMNLLQERLKKLERRNKVKVLKLRRFSIENTHQIIDKMANVNAPSGQTPTMAPPVRADDQILPHIRAFTASSGIPSIYIQQFWDTILYDKKAGCYKCQLDEQWFDLTKETLMEALQITPSEVFRMPIPDSLITAEIQQATYYQEYLEKPARKPKAPTRPSVSIPVRSAQPAPTSAPTKPQEKKRKQTTETSDKPPKEKKSKHGLVSKKRSRKNEEASKTEEALEESMKDAYALPKGSLLLVVIREPESRKYQPLPEVPGKGKAKVTEE
nr:hypothetical protein [Tanacetum cinerariifolium]